jgi:hypothetical protein
MNISEESPSEIDFVDDLLDEIDALPSVPKSFIEEKLVRLYSADTEGRDGYDQYAYIFPNGVCVVGVTPYHTAIRRPIFEGDASIDPTQHAALTVNYSNGRRDYSEVKESGAFKKRSQGVVMQSDSVVCRVLVAGGERYMLIILCVYSYNLGRDRHHHLPCSYPVFALIPGKLLEVNIRLIPSPALLSKKCNREGYIAILCPKEQDILKAKAKLLTAEAYMQLRGLQAEQLR